MLVFIIESGGFQMKSNCRLVYGDFSVIHNAEKNRSADVPQHWSNYQCNICNALQSHAI